MSSDTFHGFNRLLGAVTGVGPRLAGMEESLLKQAALRSALWQDPASRTAILSDPRMQALMGGEFTNVPLGTASGGMFPQLSPGDTAQPEFLKHITQVPRYLPPEVMTPDRAKMELEQAQTGTQQEITRQLGRQGITTDQNGNLIVTGRTTTINPRGVSQTTTEGIPPAPVEEPTVEGPAIPRGSRKKRPAAGMLVGPDGNPIPPAKDRAGRSFTFTNSQTGQQLQGTFGPDGMQATGSDGQPYVLDEKNGVFTPAPRAGQGAGAAQTPATPPGLPATPPPPGTPPGTAEAAPPPLLQRPGEPAAPQQQGEDAQRQQDMEMLGFPSPAFAAPGERAGAAVGAALAPPQQEVAPGQGRVGFPSVVIPQSEAVQGAPPTQVEPGRVAVPGPIEGGPRAQPTRAGVVGTKPKPVPGDVTSQQRENMWAAINNDQALADYVEATGKNIPQLLNDRFAVGRMRKYLHDEAVNQARDVAAAQQTGKVGAGEMGQVKRIRAIRGSVQMMMQPVVGVDNPQQLRPVDMGAGEGAGADIGRLLIAGTEGMQWLQPLVRQLTPAGVGIPGMPRSLWTVEQVAQHGSPAEAKAAGQLLRLAAGSAPQLVKAFGDTGQLSQQEQTIAREKLFPSATDTYQARVNKIDTLIQLLDDMERALLSGVNPDQVHNMATDAMQTDRTAPTRRVYQGTDTGDVFINPDEGPL